MSALDGYWLPAFDPGTGMLALPLWIAGAIAALFVIVCVIAFNRTAAGGALVLVVRYATVLVAVLLAWSLIDRSGVRERTADRRALEARASELTARAIAPGSALACLDAGTGEAVERACEKALFATPEAVASAVAYVGARLTLLADSLEYAKRVDASYAAQLTGLRRAAEADRFGVVAHVLATRDGCTAETCATFKLLQDTSRVSANLGENAFEGYLTRHVANWSRGEVFSTASTPAAPAPAPAAATAPAPGGPPVPNTYNFPSAASIPPVSIMTAEPPTPPLAAEPIVNPPPSPPRKPPQAAAPPKKQAAPPPRIPQPGQGATAADVPLLPGGQPRAQ